MFETRIKVDVITSVIINVGLTDTSALEIPFELGAADAITSTATDAVCFVFDTGAATDNWHAIGVKNGTDTAATNSGSAPVAATWQKFRIEVDSNGTATFLLNDKYVAKLANAVTVGTDLTPVVVVVADNTTSKLLDVDYVHVSVDR